MSKEIEGIIAPYGKEIYIIKHRDINLMISWALMGLTNEFNKYCGVLKRTKNNDKKKAYDYILTDIINKQNYIRNLDNEYHLYCLESAQKTMILEKELERYKKFVNSIEIDEKNNLTILDETELEYLLKEAQDE
jgi:heme oxygenase